MDLVGIPGNMGRLGDGPGFFGRQEIMSRAWDLLKTSNLPLLAPGALVRDLSSVG